MDSLLTLSVPETYESAKILNRKWLLKGEGMNTNIQMIICLVKRMLIIMCLMPVVVLLVLKMACPILESPNTEQNTSLCVHTM